MTKENAAYLFGGFAFGILVGVALFSAFQSTPDLAPGGAAPVAAPSPAPPMGQGAGAANDSAPMVGEINRLKRQLQQEPGNLPVITRLAHLHHDAQMWEQAIEFYDMALNLDPNNADLLTDQGICYRGMGRFDQALARFSRAQEVKPDHWQSLFNAAVVKAFDLSDYDGALEALDPLMKQDPPPPRVAELHQAVSDARDAQ